MKTLKVLIGIFIVFTIGIKFTRFMEIESVVIQYVHPIDSVSKTDTLDLSVYHFGKHTIGQALLVYFVKNMNDSNFRDNEIWPLLPSEDSLALVKLSGCRAVFVNAKVVQVIN